MHKVVVALVLCLATATSLAACGSERPTSEERLHNEIRERIDETYDLLDATGNVRTMDHSARENAIESIRGD